MKTILTILLFFSAQAFAANKYFSNAGNDNTGTGTILAPYATIAKLNLIFSSLSPGDSVLFRKGDTFIGTITPSRSGSSGSPIKIGAYGTGAQPLITSLVPMVNWIPLGGNIWESDANTSLGSTVNVVLDDGVLLPLGRYPNLNTANAGYLKFETHTGTNSITDNELLGSPSWVGAEAVVRVNHFTTEVRTIGSHSNNILTFTSSFSTTPTDGMGYFFQDNARTLDQQGEWYYNPTTKKIRIFSTSMPTNIQATSLANLVLSTTYDYITFTDLTFKGANLNAFEIGVPNPGDGGDHIVIKNSSISFAQIGIYASRHTIITINNNSITNCLADGIHLIDAGASAVTNNSIYSTYQIAGMGGTGGGNGIFIKAAGANVQYNRVIKSGYCGIKFDADNIVIQNNLIDTFCNIKNDGGGIYIQGATIRTGQQVKNNIVLHGIGATAGSKYPTLTQAEALYGDNDASNVLWHGNTAAYCDKGFYHHRGLDNTVTNNTFFSNRIQFNSNSNSSTEFTRDLIMKNNIFFAKTTSQYLAAWSTSTNDIPLEVDYLDSNYYCRPKSEPQGINNAGTSTGAIISVTAGVTGWYSLDKWQLVYRPWDSLSKKSPKTYDTIRFEYNASNRDSIVILNDPGNGLPYTYLDARGTRYKTTLTLGAYQSVVLIRDTVVPSTPPNQPPVITLTSPADGATYIAPASVTWSATATDADGTITNVQLYNGSTLLDSDNSSPYSKVLLGVGTGSYSLTAKATDNSGNTTTSAARNITVSAANVPPSVSIISPADSSYYSTPADISIDVDANDSDGTISSVKIYNNTTLITTLTTLPYSYTWTGKTTGQYNLSAVSFDDDGDSATSAVVHIFVNEAPDLQINTLVGNILCNGGSADIIVNATGGTAPYSGTGTFNRSAGTHQFIVEDALGAKDTADIILTGPALLTASASTGTISVYGGSTTATISSGGGTAPKQYRLTKNGISTAWQASNVFTVTVGSYTAEVKDANNCTASTTFSLTQPSAPSNVIIHGKSRKHTYVGP